MRKFTTMDEHVIISVGGSLIAPDNINIKFLKDLKERVELYIKKGHKFIMICGGGKTARNYQSAARSVTKTNNEDLDWLGIHATRLNAHLLRTVFREQAYPRIITDPTEEVDFKEPILVSAGWRPGFSTDYCAVVMAKQHNVKKLVNMSNIDHVYNKDPNKSDDARPFSRLSWEDFIDILPEKWDPGMSTPFDPVAAKEAKELDMEVAIINGNHLERLDNYLSGGEVKGTIIK